MKENLWHHLHYKKALEILNTKETGLAHDEAEQRLKNFGKNVLPKQTRDEWWKIAVYQIKSPLVYILIFAAFLSLILKNWLDLFIIFLVVFVNTAFGFFQEYKANRAIEKLKNYIQYKATVLRDGEEAEIPTEEIVPGDIIILEEGARVPADARLMKSTDFEVVESQLTGESAPAKKNIEKLEKGVVLADRDNMVYMGTYVTRGMGVGVVCATGKNTELGGIAQMISETHEEKTPLQIKLERLTQVLSFIIVFISLVVILIGVIKGRPLIEPFDGHEEGILYTAVVLAVAAIPEGLLVAVTIILALGIQKILKEKALVRRLIAAETLGSTTVICADKTGTLTEGKMSVVKIALPDKIYSVKNLLNEKEKKPFENIIRVGLLCNNAYIENYENDVREWSLVGDTTETALLTLAVKFGYDLSEVKKENPREGEIPFHSETKYMATLHKRLDGQNFLAVKGSPESILEKSKLVKISGKKLELTQEYLKKLKEQYEYLSKSGLRILAAAYKKTNKNELRENDITGLVFLGFFGLNDPVRAEAKETFLETKSAGLRTVIVTGDHKFTTQMVAQKIGMSALDQSIVEGRELDLMTDDELYRKIKNIDIFARVNPHHKIRIVDAWQKRGEVVAMTGDGVNDAAALKAADIGIAFNSGTDVAKENADLVLLDNNFKTIVKAIERGRIIFDNIRKLVLYLMSNSFAEIILVTASIIFGLPLPLIPVQILWINLISDGAPALSFAFEAGERDVMLDRPRKKHEPIINSQIISNIIFMSLGLNIPLFALFYFGYASQYFGSIDYLRTIIFSSLAVSSLLYSFSCRSLKHSVFKKDIFSNWMLNLSVIAGIILQFVAVYSPFFQTALKTTRLRVEDWFVVLVFSIISISIIEITKFIYFRKKQKLLQHV